MLKSTKLAVVLCLVLAAAGIAGSLLYQGNTSFGKQGPFNVFRSPFFLVPACLLILNILFCAVSRLATMPLSRPRTWSFSGIHLGLLLMAIGLILDGLFGFIGTRYYYLGVPDFSYFDWRKNREEPFPFTVEIAGIETRNHPLNLRIGVRDGAGGDAGTYTVREGGSFTAGKTGLVVTPRRFDIESKTLFIDAAVGGAIVSGARVTAGSPAAVGGYSIFPVAFADPEPSGHAARVRFTLPGRAPEEKEIRINHPARYAGLSFCLVNVGADRFGNPYAGLQMTREPGEIAFWIGALLFSVSLLVHLSRGPGVLAMFIIVLVPCWTHAFGTVIDGKTDWEGEVRIAEPVTVEKGGVLRIRPGTTVLLSGEDRDGDGCRDGYIQVFGKILVEGERNRPVRFVRMHGEKAWEEIFLKDASAAIRHAVIEGASWGLHVHGGDVKVEHATFLGNGGGARLKGTGASFIRCTFRGNGIGVRFWDGGPSITGSVIEGNGTGLFYREGNGGGKINGNLIVNRDWNLKIGDWAAGDLDVSGNFWGDGGNDAAGMRVEDFREGRNAGRIVLFPALSSPPRPSGADGREKR